MWWSQQCGGYWIKYSSSASDVDFILSSEALSFEVLILVPQKHELFKVSLRLLRKTKSFEGDWRQFFWVYVSSEAWTLFFFILLHLQNSTTHWIRGFDFRLGVFIQCQRSCQTVCDALVDSWFRNRSNLYSNLANRMRITD